jgi:hypothetical protein
VNWRLINGECRLCDGEQLLVMWLGPVQTDRGSAPLHACEPCVRRLESRVREYQAQEDAAPAR